MIQQDNVYINDLHEFTIFIHDDVKFIEWCNECIEILNRVKGIEKANMHVYDVIANESDEYSIKVAAIFSSSGRQLEGSMYISYDDLLKITGLDIDGCLDIVNIGEKTKLELYKFLLTRFWDYYKYSKKFFER